MALDSNCPCGTGRTFEACCARFLNGTQHATTAEELMRSRYSAFATGQERYLMDTWHPRTRPTALDLDPGQIWTRLDVIGRTGGGPLDQEGTVDFIAHYRVLTRADKFRENSRFERLDGRWFYVADE
jgi:SEC-C motif-containing protein